MTHREETYLINTVKELKKTVDENNKMLRYIVRYINHNISRESNEEFEDFGRNVLANIVSNKFNR